VAIIKKRSGRHEKSIREFRLDSGVGIRIGQPLAQFQGILTGIPSFIGESRDMLSESDGHR